MSGNYEEIANNKESIFRDKLFGLRSSVLVGKKQTPRDTYLQALTRESSPVFTMQGHEPADSMFDGLTNLYSKWFFLRWLNYELMRAERYKRPLSICLITIDQLPSYAEQFGQEAVLEILVAVSKTITSTIREVDIPARDPDGGFAILFPETNFSGITTVANRLCPAIREHPIIYASSTLPCTISIGAASFPAHARKPEELLSFATQSLNLAMERGGNRFCLANS